MEAPKDAVVRVLNTKGQFTAEEREALAEAIVAALRVMLQDDQIKKEIEDLDYQVFTRVMDKA